MKLAYITSAYGRASDTFVRSEVSCLRSLGHEVTTFSVNRPESSHLVSEEVRQEQERTTYVLEAGFLALIVALLREALIGPRRFVSAIVSSFALAAPGLRGRSRQMAYLMEASFVAGHMRRLGTEHIHDHIGEGSGSVAALAALLAGISYSITVHGPSIFYAPEQFRLGNKISGSAFIACISNYCRSQCMAFSDSTAWDRLKIVHCGVDDSFVATAPKPVSSNSRLVCVGRLSQEKGHVPLLRAAAQLLRNGVAVELVLVGDGPMRPMLEAMIGDLALTGQVRIAGWSDSQGVRDAIQTSRALVVPSFAEGLPVVIMEALALGRPVVSTQIAGIPELVQPGVNGWLVPAGSVDALADAMRECLQTPVERLTEMGLAGRRRVLEMHDVNKEARKLAELFREAIGERSDAAAGEDAATACTAAGGVINS